MNTHKHSPGSIISVSNISKINSDINDEGGNENGNNEKKKIIIEWSYDNEEILAEWCDIAQCYKWLNHHAHDYYSSLHAWFTIPAITFSTISGTASFASASIPIEFQSYAPMAIGTINIMIGILTTIQQYLKVSELKESFRLAAISWDKYARNICIELSKSPSERIDAGTFLKFSRQEYDRLMESNQSIPPHIILKFRRNFRGRTPEEKKRFDLIKKPDICDVIVSINEKRHMWFSNQHNTENTETDSIDTTSTFREYMIYKQNTINNRNIPYSYDNIPEPEQNHQRGSILRGFPSPSYQNNQPTYNRQFSKENLFKHDHDIESNTSNYVGKKTPGYNQPNMSPTRRTSKQPPSSAPRRISKDAHKTASPEPRRTSKDYVTNIKDSFLNKLFNNVSSKETDMQHDREQINHHYHEKYDKIPKKYSTTVNSRKPSVIRKTHTPHKTSDYSDNISETTVNTYTDQQTNIDEYVSPNNNERSPRRNRSDSLLSANRYNMPTEKPITLVPFNKLSMENKEPDSINSSNSSLPVKNGNKMIKRVTHESDSKLTQMSETPSQQTLEIILPTETISEENIIITYQEDDSTDAGKPLPND
jgi:hypothetical protein